MILPEGIELGQVALTPPSEAKRVSADLAPAPRITLTIFGIAGAAGVPVGVWVARALRRHVELLDRNVWGFSPGDQIPIYDPRDLERPRDYLGTIGAMTFDPAPAGTAAPPPPLSDGPTNPPS
jgi:hypothetical protein